MTCQDCIHYVACLDIISGYYGDDFSANGNCKNFKDKSKFIELPCKKNDIVYYITGIYGTIIKKAKVLAIIANENGIKELYVESEDGTSFMYSFHSFYLTKEEAEKALLGKKRKDDL